MAAARNRIWRVLSASRLARRMLRPNMQAVAGAVAHVMPDARKIAGVRRARQSSSSSATVSVTAAPANRVSRLLASSLVLFLMVGGVSPCVAALAAKPVSLHDCCDPEMMENEAPAAAMPVLAAGPADCCVMAPDAQAPARPVTQAPSPSRDAVLVAAPLSPALNSTSALPLAIDLRSRPAPRPPLTTVLLI